MSALKKKLVDKLNKVPSIREHFNKLEPSDITFVKNGCRNDVVRWVLGNNAHCFSSATLCVKNEVELSYCENQREIFAVWPSDKLPRELK